MVVLRGLSILSPSHFSNVSNAVISLALGRQLCPFLHLFLGSSEGGVALPPGSFGLVGRVTVLEKLGAGPALRTLLPLFSELTREGIMNWAPPKIQ